MSLSVGRESMSKFMSELVDSFPLEGDGRASISDFGKLLFTEGQSGSSTGNTSTATTSGGNGGDSTTTIKEEIKASGNDEDDDDDEDDNENSDDDDDNVDEEATPQPGTKRVFTEIKGVPRQKHHDVQVMVSESGSIAITQGGAAAHKLMKQKDKAIPKRWSPEEDELLRQAVGRHGERNWKSIAEEVPGRNHTQCLQRWTKVLAPGLVKGHWRPDEDELLKELVAEGRKNWGQVANRIPGRTSKQCRERWYNHLDPSIVRGEYTAEEDRIIVEAQSRLGNKWSTIAAMLPGRTEDAVKIRWKSLCRVRKGQGRRDKTKTSGKSSGFSTHMIKGEELGSFAPIQTQATPMGRVPVPAGMMAHPVMAPMGNGMPPTVVYAAPGTYNPAMGGYPRGHVVMHPVNSYGQPVGPPVIAVPASSVNIDRRANIVNISAPSQGGAFRPVYASTSSPYGMVPTATDANGNVYTSAPAYMGSSPMYRTQMMSAPQMMGASPMMSTSYGYGMSPMAGSSPVPMQGAAGATGYHAQYGQQQQYQSMDQYGNPQFDQNGQNYSSGDAQASNVQDVASSQSLLQQSTNSEPQHQPEGQPTNDQTPQSSTDAPAASATSNPAAAFASKFAPAPKPSTPNLAASFAQSLSTPKASSNGPNPAAMFAQTIGAKSASSPAAAFAQSQKSPAPSPNPALAFAQAAAQKASTPTNPAALFAQNLVTKSATSAPTQSQPSPFNKTPVTAFLQQQQKRTNADVNGTNSPKQQSKGVVPFGAGSSSTKPFNPAAAFAQSFQSSSQKPPIPSSASSVKSAEDDETMDSEDGEEPSLKKVKPRTSIDFAARASAARRMRNSGSGGALMGRRSLDVFLNEIGDVGRISDLKMDEFQNMDELWRVSGDMDRLSL